MTALVQSLLERLSPLPESMQNHLATRFLKEIVAQAHHEELTLVAHDPKLSTCSVSLLW